MKSNAACVHLKISMEIKNINVLYIWFCLCMCVCNQKKRFMHKQIIAIINYIWMSRYILDKIINPF